MNVLISLAWALSGLLALAGYIGLATHLGYRYHRRRLQRWHECASDFDRNHGFNKPDEVAAVFLAMFWPVTWLGMHIANRHLTPMISDELAGAARRELSRY